MRPSDPERLATQRPEVACQLLRAFTLDASGTVLVSEQVHGTTSVDEALLRRSLAAADRMATGCRSPSLARLRSLQRRGPESYLTSAAREGSSIFLNSLFRQISLSSNSIRERARPCRSPSLPV